MTSRRAPRRAWLIGLLVTALCAVAGRPAHSQVAHASGTTLGRFPRIPIWAFPGAWQDSTLLFPRRCQGVFQGPLPDSVREQPRTITVRFLRDRVAESRPEFGGYRIYRVTNTPDTTRMEL